MVSLSECSLSESVSVRCLVVVEGLCRQVPECLLRRISCIEDFMGLGIGFVGMEHMLD